MTRSGSIRLYNCREMPVNLNTADLCCVRISSFAVDDSVGWLVQVSLTLFAFTPSTSLALPVNAKNVRLTCTSQPTESSTAKLEIRSHAHSDEVGGKTSAVEEVQMLILQLCLLSEGSQKPGTASSAL